MERRFTSAPIKMLLPKVNSLTKTITLTIQNSTETEMDLNISCCQLTDYKNNSVNMVDKDVYYHSCKGLKWFTYEAQMEKILRPLMDKTLSLKVTVLCGRPLKATDVYYKLDYKGVMILEGVETRHFTDNEKAYWLTLSPKPIDKPPVPPIGPEPFNPSNPVIRRFMDSLNKEILFLKSGKGKKYKATQGVLISDDKGEFIYQFELETELHLSENAPVKLELQDMYYLGEVLLCEDFTILIVLEKYIGEKVSLAFMSVEPWRLLVALRDKLFALDSGRVISPIANKLIEEGPNLIRKQEGIEKIKTGQNTAVFMSESNPITIIWGPPGTGKTTTMAKIALDFERQNKSVLIVSHSNVSVDGVIKKIVEMLPEDHKEDILMDGRVIRYGYVRDDELGKNPYATSFNYVLSTHKELYEQKQYLEKVKKEIKQRTYDKASKELADVQKALKALRIKVHAMEKAVASDAFILATTISKVTIDDIFEGRKYDAVMFDEASMAYIPQIFSAACYAREHFICVGDFCQLSPIVQSPGNDELKKDIFDYLRISSSVDIHNHPWLVMLNEQYRMHPDITDFVNKYVYHGKLYDNEKVKRKRLKACSNEPFPDKAMTILDLRGTYCAAGKTEDNSRYNFLSAAIAFCTALKVEKEGSFEKGLGIISPYAAQTKLIRSMVLDYRKNNKTDIACSTVHQFQGSEKDVIIFDAVESYPRPKPGFLMSRNDNRSLERLINVAVSRARVKLIVPCNTGFWKQLDVNNSNTFAKLIKHMDKRGNVVSDKSLMEHINSCSVDSVISIYTEQDECIERFKKDCMNAREKIIVTIPKGKLDEKASKEILDTLQQLSEQRVEVSVLARDKNGLPEEWRSFVAEDTSVIFPIVIIDKKLIWYGLPKSDAKFVFSGGAYLTVNWMAVRFSGEHTASLMLSMCGLNAVTGVGVKTGSFSKYVKDNTKCPMCGSPLELRRKNGYYLFCPKCKKTQLMTTLFVNSYLDYKKVRCPIHKCEMEARLGRHGIYVCCDGGVESHSVKLESI